MGRDQGSLCFGPITLTGTGGFNSEEARITVAAATGTKERRNHFLKLTKCFDNCHDALP